MMVKQYVYGSQNLVTFQSNEKCIYVDMKHTKQTCLMLPWQQNFSLISYETSSQIAS